MKSFTSSDGNQADPRRTSISVAAKSAGCTDFSASTFSAKRGSVSAAASATASFSRTLPERYWSSVSHSFVCGLRKISPFKSGRNSSTGLFSKPAMRSRSTPPHSFKLTSSASLGVPTDWHHGGPSSRARSERRTAGGYGFLAGRDRAPRWT